MRAARAVLALFVLLSIVLATSGNVPVRGDAQVMSCDDSADPPACTACASPIIERPLRASSMFELATFDDPGPLRRVAILTSAPKTSPPAI